LDTEFVKNCRDWLERKWSNCHTAQNEKVLNSRIICVDLLMPFEYCVSDDFSSACFEWLSVLPIQLPFVPYPLCVHLSDT